MNDNILVIGGNGTIGIALVNYLLMQNHVPYVIDRIQSLENDSNDSIYLDDNSWNIEQYIITYNINTVVHLGENLTADKLNNPRFINDNVHEFAHVLDVCSKYGVSCKVCTWHNHMLDFPDNILKYSLLERSRVCDYYNKGNAAISRIVLPNLISFNYPASNWFGILTKIMNGFLYSNNIYIDDSEYNDNDFLWGDSFSITSELYTKIFDRSRGYYYCRSNGQRFTIKEMVEIVMDVLGIEQLSFEVYNQLRYFNRGNAKEYPEILEMINRALDEVIIDTGETYE